MRESAPVFREVKNGRQEPDAGPRRWFEAEALELVVWGDDANNPTGFQLCYDVGRGEHALTWRRDAGFTHSAIDDGERTPLRNETPVLILSGMAPWPEIVRLFDARSGSLEPALRDFVRAHLAAEAARAAPAKMPRRA